MKKILILGCSGSGKTMLALELGKMLNLEVIHLDSLYWKPGWIKTPKDEWIETVKNIIIKDSWIIDGNFSSTIDIRIKEADTAVYLDFPRLFCIKQVIKRWIFYTGRNRPDMGTGCKEKIDLEFIMWIWNFNSNHRPDMMKKLEEYKGKKEIYILKNYSEIKEFLKKVNTLYLEK